jgi:hypothetical protein
MNLTTKKRLENQMRIHWSWLKELTHEQAAAFIVQVIEKAESNISKEQ